MDRSYRSILKPLNYLFFILILVLNQHCSRSRDTSYPVEPPVSSEILYESRERPDIPNGKSPEGIKVVQITSHPEHESWHVYTEARIFTPDSRRFIFVREGDYWICDIEDNFGIRQVTDEPGAIGPSIDPEGEWMYYFVDRTLQTEGTLTLKRLSLDDFTRETLLTITGEIPGTQYKPSRIYSLSSISSDGKRLCTSCFLGDGETETAPWGLLVFNLENPSVSLVFKDTHYNNMHPQYCLSKDPEFSHDILLQHNHGSEYDKTGRTTLLVGGKGADLHVIRDDGTHWRDIPIGRDGKEFVQGHQQWRGRSNSVLSAMYIPGGKNRILEGYPIATDENTTHTGFNIPGGKYYDITRNIENPDFWHFSSDLSGMYVVSDTQTRDPETGDVSINLVIGSLHSIDNPELTTRYLLNTGTSGDGQKAHPHPFFSPDTKMAFFNSDREGKAEIWMVTGYTFP